jgi:SpoVK/Ycf46/Vps4 family AAA+-type ATPase
MTTCLPPDDKEVFITCPTSPSYSFQIPVCEIRSLEVAAIPLILRDPLMAPPVKNLQELIDIGKDNLWYTNIDSYMYYGIRPVLIELSCMIGMATVKSSIFEMVIYYLQHLHIPRDKSGLYSVSDPVSHLYKKYLEEEKAYKERLQLAIEMEEQKKFRELCEKRLADEEKKKEEEKARSKKEGAKSSTSNRTKGKRPRDDSSDSEDERRAKRRRRFQEEEAKKEQHSSSSKADKVVEVPPPPSKPALIRENYFAYIGPRPIFSIYDNNSPATDYNHMIICGPPGTGKTTVGQIIGRLISAMKILKTYQPTPVFSVAHRTELVGEYLGQSAMKTRRLLDKHRGGVLMIDEAYSLGDPTDKFVVEVMDTIVSYLSDHKDDIVVIFVGYKDYIFDRLLPMNQGLKRRIPWIHCIDGYTPKELYQIFLKQLGESNWTTNISDLEALFEKNASLLTNFGGDIENLVTACKKKASIQSFGKDISERRIITRDIFLSEINLIRERQHSSGRHLPMYT